MEPTKACSVCKKEKLLQEFHKQKHVKSGRRSSCKACRTAYEYSLPRVKEYTKKYYKAHKEKFRDYHLFSKYKVTQEEYNNMLDSQGGVCAICGGMQDKRYKNFAVDHDHTTGVVRGLLCNNCNAGLGYLKDSVTVILAAAQYLSR